MSVLAPKSVEIGLKEVGGEEITGTNWGPGVNQYEAATRLDPEEPWPWCAAFVCGVVREAMAATGIKETATFKRPTTAGAWDLENWSLRQDKTTQTKKPHHGDIKAGDIVVFTFSHVGIAVGEPDDEGWLSTVEGNTDSSGSREGGGVFRKRRKLSSIWSRIRFTV